MVLGNIKKLFKLWLINFLGCNLAKWTDFILLKDQNKSLILFLMVNIYYVYNMPLIQ